MKIHAKSIDKLNDEDLHLEKKLSDKIIDSINLFISLYSALIDG